MLDQEDSLAVAAQMYGDIRQLLGARFVVYDMWLFERTQLPSFSKRTSNVTASMALPVKGFCSGQGPPIPCRNLSTVPLKYIP